MIRMIAGVEFRFKTNDMGGIDVDVLEKAECWEEDLYLFIFQGGGMVAWWHGMTELRRKACATARS